MYGSHSWCSEITGPVGSLELLNEVSVWNEPLRCHRRMDRVGVWVGALMVLCSPLLGSSEGNGWKPGPWLNWGRKRSNNFDQSSKA